MNPWELLGWVAVVALCAVIAALALLVVVEIVRGLLPDKPGAGDASEEVFHGDGK